MVWEDHMKSILLAVLAVVVLSACTTSGRLRMQIGTDVDVQNDCAPILEVEQTNKAVTKIIPYSRSAWVETISHPIGAYQRCTTLRAKGYTAEMGYLGSE